MSYRLEPAPGVLYVVGTPIGNLGDLSPRAKSILEKVSAIACEDTRHSGQLIKKIRTEAKLVSFHKHNNKSRIPQLLELLEQGQSIALISDAGLPGISDPGEDLIATAYEAGHEIICIPGPCAATTALVISGLGTQRFCFEGFLPFKGRERKERLKEIAAEPRTIIIYEAPHRLKKLLQELLETCGSDRPLRVARELTKVHEQQLGKTIGEVLEHFSLNKPIGEFTLVLGGANPITPSQENDDALLKDLKMLIANGASAIEASKELSTTYKRSRRSIYALLHKK